MMFRVVLPNEKTKNKLTLTPKGIFSGKKKIDLLKGRR